MKDNLTSFERRLSLLFFLMRNGSCTISVLASIFDVSERTIRRDIDLLSRYSPIYTKIVIGGGVFMYSGYRNELFRYLSLDEEDVLKKAKELLMQPEKAMIDNIINRYTMPKPYNTYQISRSK